MIELISTSERTYLARYTPTKCISAFLLCQSYLTKNYVVIIIFM